MRAMLVALLMLTSAPAAADEWQRYENGPYGYALDVPPGFADADEFPGLVDAGSDKFFKTPTAGLHVHTITGNPYPFEMLVMGDIGGEETVGNWVVDQQVVTPQLAQYWGTQGARRLFVALLPLCDGAVAKLRLVYYVADTAAFTPIVERLARSFKQTAAC